MEDNNDYDDWSEEETIITKEEYRLYFVPRLQECELCGKVETAGDDQVMLISESDNFRHYDCHFLSKN